MVKLNSWKMACVIFVFCTATAIASPAQTLTTLVSFAGTNGAHPYSSLIQSADGNFYGTTSDGGSNANGTVFKMTPLGALTTIYTFCSQEICADGGNPMAALVQVNGGNFYGTTYNGGANGHGTVFQITPSGTLTTLYSFCSKLNCSDGSNPSTALVPDGNGNLYGTTEEGGNSHNVGTVYKITPNGTLTTLYSFCSLSGCSDGSYPLGGLVQTAGGDLYGTTSRGGNSNGNGTIYKITPSGTLTTLYSFCNVSNCPDGFTPIGGLVQAAGGDLYGTTQGDNKTNSTVFKITAEGVLTTLHVFTGADGSYPEAALMLDSDGNFYGTTSTAGQGGGGTIFKMTPGGALSTVYSFCSQTSCADGSSPHTALVQASDGNLYGTTVSGGDSNGDGTVFSLSATAPAVALQFVPLSQPCRAVDTRPIHGGNGPIPGGTSQSFAISGGGSCATLPDAAVYSTNVTVVPTGKMGSLTVWPAGKAQPPVPTLNSLDGRVKANAAVVSAGNSGQVSIFATDTTNVVVDVNGYFAPATGSTLAFYPLAPCRVVDTRSNAYPQGLGAPALTGGIERQIPILNANTMCNIPTQGVAAYSLNLTVVPSTELGYLTVWPTGGSRPTVSALNDVLGNVIANAAIVVAGPGGDISAYATDDTDLVIDINGYFAPAGEGGLSLYAVQPCRVLDTRHVGNGAPFTGVLNPPGDVLNAQCGVSTQALGYVLNATVIPVSTLGYLTLWPDGENQPVVSTLNAVDGSITNNMAIVPAGTAGKIDAYVTNLTQLLLDVSAYFAP